MNPNLKRQICLIKNQTEIAEALATKPQTVSLWLKSQVPSHRVIPLCKFLDWKITPHEVRGDIYPNPTDGLPKQES
ncbi:MULTISPECIES: YdaS family helix-turn-helix protein [Enterobacter cloacae complex]|uniref:transcriptional regulator n=1 Tax=Enterobacter cloacae complex TaxID=354276 RepID=UPI0005F1B39F|nr:MULTISPECIES: YdaS family helix-turn-helix protein [Enterobacter cloacae complex]MBS7117908.1 helix-turn-helix domain-containing protein [Enterobacter cloacae]MCU3033132.1 helix-turn-helix domain-containing protein [Enterobacter hormaechei subsp. hoffmannii]HCJ6304051.1 helix-turn-helix domain-containing protein [Enterobacter hormaechei subsp. xiangfangensis]HCM9116061.1 helix-turn-helix domain-containing protein [Enterobacter hormaechei subsp. steigerwaltii]EHN8769378.1 helix-turn-helix do